MMQNFLKTFLSILLLSGFSLENSAGAEPEEFISNFIDSVESQPIDVQLYWMNYLVLVHSLWPNLDQSQTARILHNFSETGGTLTVRHHAQLIGWVLSDSETMEKIRTAFDREGRKIEDAFLLFLNFLDDYCFKNSRTQ
jgi:hypothetical protein